MLPGLTINFSNGNIGTVVPTEDGVFGLLASAVAVGETFALEKDYVLKGMADVAALGIIPDINNYHLYHKLVRFYEEAGEGTELWLYAFSKATKTSEWFTPDLVTGICPAQALLDAAKGRITGLFTAYVPADGTALTIVNGVDEDVWLTEQKAQVFAEQYTSEAYSPIFLIFEGYGFTGDATELPNQREKSNNRVGIFIGNTEPRTGDVIINGASSEVLMGRLAKVPVQENPGRVKRGALETLTAFIIDEVVEKYDVAALHAKGFLTFRIHKRKAGYYIADDNLSTDDKDDYRRIGRRRVIDKAYRLAHNIATDEILEDFDVLNDGTISPLYAKTVEGNIEREIFVQMTENGELSRDQSNKDDLGVVAKFDLSKNVVETNRIDLKLRVRPKGSADFFTIDLGYDVNLNN